MKLRSRSRGIYWKKPIPTSCIKRPVYRSQQSVLDRHQDHMQPIDRCKWKYLLVIMVTRDASSLIRKQRCRRQAWAWEIAHLVSPTARQRSSFPLMVISGYSGGYNLCAPPTMLFRGASSKWIPLIRSGFTNAPPCHTAGMASLQRSLMRHHGMKGLKLIGSLTVSLPHPLLAATQEL